MIEMVAAAFILAKIRHYRLKPVFLTWTIYPVLFMECIHIIFEINIFMGNYSVVPYAPIIRKVYLFCYLIPMFRYKLYKPALVGSASVVAGTLMNNFAMALNGNKMPVYPTFSYLTGYVKTYTFDQLTDIHILGNSLSRCKILCDYIDVGYSIFSIGDLLIHLFAFLILYSAIRAANSKFNNQRKDGNLCSFL